MNSELTPGIIFEQDDRTVAELARDVIRYALEHGWMDASAAALLDYADDPETGIPEWITAYGYAESEITSVLTDVAFDASESATDYLNSIAPEGYWVGSQENAYGVWEIEDYDDGYVDDPDLTDEGNALQRALDDPRLTPSESYAGMGDPMYALASAGAIVVYGSSDLGVSARLNARELREHWPATATAHEALADALEPMLEEVSNAAEDANLETTADPYRRAGAVACEWMLRNGLGRWDYTVEPTWTRGRRVSIIPATNER